jgi:hypothetical protein
MPRDRIGDTRDEDETAPLTLIEASLLLSF